jgi:methylglyoxal/glyoxal reductase
MEQKRHLASGGDIPVVGFGTWEIFNDAATEAVSAALDTGYRLIDTAKIYSNEKQVGEAIRNSGIPREDLFVTTKLWNDDQGYDSAFAALDVALNRLGQEYIDLYLIHWPATSRRHDAWRALVELQQSGKTKHIGVSNYTVSHLSQLLEQSETVPEVNQVEFHPFIYEQQSELLAFCKQKGIVVEAYSPLSRVSSENRYEIKEVAAKHSKSEQQVVLRWCIQHGTVPLPRSQNPEHIKANLDVFDFELDDEDMKKLDSLSDGERVTWDPANMGS